MSKKVVYDGALVCHTSECCPIVVDNGDDTLTINDPNKPESGEFTATREEWALLLKSFKL